MFRQLLLKRPQRLTTLVSQRLFALGSNTGPGKQPGDAESKTSNLNQAPLNHADIPIVDFDDPDYIPLPEYPVRPNEPLQTRKQRLIYQSRKRGMLENDLLLSTFAHKYLGSLNEKQVELYDQLINGVTNDWDIYYWATQTKPTPPEYDNEIMNMLKTHVKNAERESRLMQPNLN